jgi:RND family efflux transporter MFP subunit
MALSKRLIEYLTLVAVTVLACWVMWFLSAKEPLHKRHTGIPLRPMPMVTAPKAPVAIEPVGVELCEITSTYAGKIRSWETYQVGFAVGGRVVSLGQNKSGEPLDDGDRVAAGQVLAQLDDRVFRAQKSEAAARVEQAASDLDRAQRVRATSPAAVSDSEVQQLVTDLALAKAQHEVAVKNLDDATLESPVAATIARRWIKAGESVNPHQVVFELVENDDVLLVVDVPESQIRELDHRKRVVEQNRKTRAGLDEEDHHFRAHVHLEGRDRFGNAWPPLDGEVYYIPEVADQRTGLFAVEIRLPNAEHLLRPGMVATADVVVARQPGYAIPASAVIYRAHKAYLFTVDRQPVEMELLYWNVGPADLFHARQVNLDRWIDQGETVVVPADEADLRSVVVRGHLRLGDGQLVRVVNFDKISPGQLSETKTSESQIEVASEQ